MSEMMTYTKATAEEKKDFMDIAFLECQKRIKDNPKKILPYMKSFQVVVDNIDCNFEIIMAEDDYTYQLKMCNITDKWGYNGLFFKYMKHELGKRVCHDPDSYAEAFALGFKLIKDLKFIKSEGKFMTDDDFKYIMAYQKAFGKHIKNKKEQCPVCMDVDTALRTHCNHVLCVQCWDKLPKQKCPTCRTCLIDWSDDDDEDENTL
jgi:hypothetical protein